MGQVCIWVELLVQKRLCPIFVRNVGSPDIHEYFRGLTGNQRTPGIGGVTLREFDIFFKPGLGLDKLELRFSQVFEIFDREVRGVFVLVVFLSMESITGKN